jgi:hypothetical protein
MTIAQYMENGKSFTDMMLGENIPIRDLKNWENAFQLLANRRLLRGDRTGHANNAYDDDEVDVDKQEVKE